MELSDFLKIGEVNEVQGKIVRAGIYSDKNTQYLNYNGSVLKNVGIDSFVLIRKGFNNIIGKVDGENIKEMDGNDEYKNKGNTIKRIISISILGGLNCEKFVHGLTELPLIGNFVYILEESVITKIFSFNSPKETVQLGKITGHNDYPFKIGVQEIVCSHVGIFGNTGSGKSNTLAKLYREIIDKYKGNENFKNNSKFIILDFNGEYGNAFRDADQYILSTRQSSSDVNDNPETGEIYKYTIQEEDIHNQDFWAIILEATEKTQKPFINRAIKLFEKICTKKEEFSIDSLCELIIKTQAKYIELKYTIGDIFEAFKLEKEFSKVDNIYNYHGIGKYFYKGSDIKAVVDAKTIRVDIFDSVNFNVNNIYELSHFEKFEFALKYRYWLDISRNYITKEHIAPLISRANTRCYELGKVFRILPKIDYLEECKYHKNIEILSLINLNLAMKKIIPMLICKIKYTEKKEAKKEALNSTLHFIIDEAHNILSEMSTRESEEWKDYRLESFEEIIKEGRKFGVFLTIASQRPSDISDTIISQLHNYFIHRLVNEEDLHKMRRTVSFADKASNEMIPILSAGCCLVSGLATNFPLLVQIEILPQEMQPKSENVKIEEVWIDEQLPF